mgnify:CR=1 FL=1
MKTVTLIISSLFLLMTLGVNAQGPQHRGQRGQMNPEEMIKKSVEQMKTELKLNEQQEKQVKDLLTENFKQRGELMKKYQGQRDSVMFHMKKIEDQQNASLKKILTDDQYKTYVANQEKRKQEFRKNIEVNPSAITITSVDEQLIQKCLEYIEKNMDNPEYGVEELSGDLGMVRMSLYRKLQSITGHTPTDFIRSIRLKRAAQLLQGSQLPIVEIANRVGFSSPSYFSKCFREMFGMLPKQYAEESGRKG